MGKWSDEEYETALNNAVTSPFILNCMASNSSLAFKKILKDNAVIGRKITMEILVTNIDEAPSCAEGYAYYVGGKVLSGFSVDSLGIKLPKYETVMVYTNNDAVISLTPAKTEEIFTGSTKSGSQYKVNGTIKDITQSITGDLEIIQVNE